MSKKTKLAAANPKPSALKKGVRQFSSRVGGGATSRSRRHRHGTGIRPRSGLRSKDERQVGVVPALGQTPPLSSLPPPPPRHRPQPRPSSDWAIALPDLTQEINCIESEQAKEREQRVRERKQRVKFKHRLPSYRESLQRDDADHLLDRTNFQALEPQLASILKGWMKRSQSRDQLRIEGFDRKVAIVASSMWDKAQAYVRCCPFCAPGRSLYPCDEPDLCPICHNKNVGDPIQQKFGGSFRKAGYWYALSFCYAVESKKARLRFITRRDSKRRPIDPETLAFPSDPVTVRRLTQLDQKLEACGQVPFKVLGRMCASKRLRIGGALGGLDLYVDFFPVGTEAVGHGLFVHVHALVNSSQPLSWEDAQRIYTLFCKQRSKAGISLFPDLEIALLPTEKDFKNWLRYVLKPMKFEEFYAKGAADCADRAKAFNDEFDQTVFTGANLAYGSVKTPRFYGNMQQRKKDKQSFIGVWQYPPTLNQKDFKRIRDELKKRHPKVTAEEMETYEEHLLYLHQQGENRRARKARKEQREQAQRRGGRRAASTSGSGADAGGDSDARAEAYARFKVREGEP